MTRRFDLVVFRRLQNHINRIVAASASSAWSAIAAINSAFVIFVVLPLPRCKPNPPRSPCQAETTSGRTIPPYKNCMDRGGVGMGRAGFAGGRIAPPSPSAGQGHASALALVCVALGADFAVTDALARWPRAAPRPGQTCPIPLWPGRTLRPFLPYATLHSSTPRKLSSPTVRPMRCHVVFGYPPNRGELLYVVPRKKVPSVLKIKKYIYIKG